MEDLLLTDSRQLGCEGSGRWRGDRSQDDPFTLLNNDGVLRSEGKGGKQNYTQNSLDSMLCEMCLHFRRRFCRFFLLLSFIFLCSRRPSLSLSLKDFGFGSVEIHHLYTKQHTKKRLSLPLSPKHTQPK